MSRPTGSKNRVQTTICKRGHPLVAGYCSSCSLMRAKRWAKANPEKRRKMCRDWYWSQSASAREDLKSIARQERASLRVWVGEIKTSAGCADCGFNKWPEALDFDHLRDKKRDVASLVNGRNSKEDILREIAKCEVVCANCHRRRTTRRARGL